jgi:hypothetical protein
VKYDAKGKALARSQFTDPMPHLYTVKASRTFLRPFVDGERDAVALPEPDDLDT